MFIPSESMATANARAMATRGDWAIMASRSGIPAVCAPANVAGLLDSRRGKITHVTTFAHPLVAVSGSLKELVGIVLIVLVPLVPVTYLGWQLLASRQRSRSMEHALESGRSPATPFAAISVVGTVIAVAAVLVLVIVVAARAVAT
jgi:hypothetical protein